MSPGLSLCASHTGCQADEHHPESFSEEPHLVVSAATFVEPCAYGEEKSLQALGRASPARVLQNFHPYYCYTSDINGYSSDPKLRAEIS